MTTLRAGAATDVGQVRAINQDSYLLSEDKRLFGVADGIGGHQGGEVASALAVEVIEELVDDHQLETLVRAVHTANRTIFERAGSDPNLHGMGTTFVGIEVVDGPEGDEIGWVNVGDSRLYLFRDEDVIQLTADHSLVEELVREGQLTPEEARVHPQRNIVTRSLGIDLDVNTDDGTVLPFNGDRYLLCSDGLSNEVSSEEMGEVLGRVSDPGDAATELVALANAHGGRDNITVVIVDVLDDGGRAERASAILAAEPPTGESVLPPASGDIVREADTMTQPAVGAADGDGLFTPASAPTNERELFAGRRSSLPDADDDYAAEVDDPFDSLDGMRARRITWRVIAFFVVLILIGVAVIGAMGWTARNSYYVAYNDTGNVTVYRGKPGGVLFFNPEELRVDTLTRDEVKGKVAGDLVDGREFTSREAAESFVTKLNAAADEREKTTTTTTVASTTTTTAAATTTTKPAATTTTAAPGP